MTANDFRKLALSFPGAIEAAHVGHPDFRAGGRIFATLGYPDDNCGVLVLTPDEQQEATARHPEMFSPVAGGWGRRGSTVVLLRATRLDALRPWMEMAWRQKAESRRKRSRKSVGNQGQ